MKRWLPFPLLSLALLATWLALNQTLAAGQVILGAVIALGGGLALAMLQAPRGGARRPLVAAQLAWLVLVDIAIECRTSSIAWVQSPRRIPAIEHQRRASVARARSRGRGVVSTLALRKKLLASFQRPARAAACA